MNNMQMSIIKNTLDMRIFVALCFITTALAAYVIINLVYTGMVAPLWLDETWSAMIATRPDWASFWQEAQLDVNPPLYYVILRFWVTIFGDSNIMLRLPSILFVMIAAALPIVCRPQGLHKIAAWAWAGLILFWPFGQTVMLDARGYALLMFLSTASCLVIIHMLDNMTLPKTAAWVALGTMMFLTHYYASVLIMAQTLLLTMRYRFGIVRFWPAALISIPGIIWFIMHASRLQDYARADVVWQSRITFSDIGVFLGYIIGARGPLMLFAMVTILVLAILNSRKIENNNTSLSTLKNNNLALTAATAAIGFVIAVGIGMFQASLVYRYLIPLVPPALLAIILVSQKSKNQIFYSASLVFLFLFSALNTGYTKDAVFNRAIYGYEADSNFISTHNPDHITFLWDHPASKILKKTSLENIGGYFFNRAGIDVPVTALVIPDTADANIALRAAAQGKRPAIIWLYNTDDKTSARNHAPTFEGDPEWTCHDRGLNSPRAIGIGAIACVKLGKIDD